MYDKKDVGKRIKVLRKERRLTQEKLSESLGFEASTICKFETGSQNLSIEYAFLIADYFGVTINYLLCGDQLIDDEVTEKYKKISEDRKILAKNTILGVLNAFLQK